MDLNGKKILIIRLSALGDVIRTVPSVLGLVKAFPNSDFTWLVESSSAGLFPGLKSLKTIIIDRNKMRSKNPFVVLKEFKRILSDIRSKNFEISIDFHCILKSAILPFLAGIPERAGYMPKGSKEGAHLFYNHQVPLKNHRISRYEKNVTLARFFSDQINVAEVKIDLDPSIQNRIMKVMQEKPIILIPGTSMHGRNKQWPAESWAILFKNLVERYPVKFVFGPADDHYREQLQKHLGMEPPALAPLSIPQLGVALQQARLVVVCDTGPMHLASVLQVPLLALMGPSDPVIAQPLLEEDGNPKSSMIVPEVPCSPCRNRSCEELICQTFTTPALVFDRIAAACDG